METLADNRYRAHWAGAAPVDFELTRERCYSGVNDQFKWDEIHAPLYQLAVESIPDQAVAYDLGCGSGYGADILRRRARHVQGFDVDATALAFAKLRAPGCAFTQCDLSGPWEMNNTPFPADAIVAIESIEHVPDGYEFLLKSRTCVRQGGVLFLTTPESKGATIDNPYHLHEYTKGSLRLDLEQAGFTDISWIKHPHFQDSLIVKATCV